jgi:simple sugar transport system ATP-binding protein
MAILELSSVSKHFGAIRALTEVSLTLRAGEVVGLMGDNGAGKSTLVKVIAGNFPPSAGTVSLQGRPVTFHKPSDARAQGIEIVYQDLALCDNLSAAENVFLGRELTRGFGPLRWIDYRSKRARATSCAACRAASARRSRSRARAWPSRRSC